MTRRRRTASTLGSLALAALVGACASPGGTSTHAGAGETHHFISVPILVANGTIEMRQIEITTGRDMVGGLRTVELPAGEVWPLLPAIFNDLGMELNHYMTARRESGSVDHGVSGEFVGNRLSFFLDCGHDPGLMRPLADQSMVNLSVVASVSARGPDASTLDVRVGGMARSAVNAGRVTCISIGRLESLIARMVEIRGALGAAGGTGSERPDHQLGGDR